MLQLSSPLSTQALPLQYCSCAGTFKAVRPEPKALDRKSRPLRTCATPLLPAVEFTVPGEFSAALKVMLAGAVALVVKA